jgi:hypothetical protein
MGKNFLDQYSILHVASGVVAYFWGVSAPTWFFTHLAFEAVENTTAGMKLINDSLTFWPGGKPRADEFLNIVGDNVSAMAGWYLAFKLDQRGKEKGWY